jgi:hypothetical protein
MKKRLKEGVELIELQNCGFETYYPFKIYVKILVTKSNRDELVKLCRREIDEYFEVISKPLRPI